jgi:hypothetical protein
MNWLKIEVVLLEYTRKTTNILIKPDLPYAISRNSNQTKQSIILDEPKVWSTQQQCDE